MTRPQCWLALLAIVCLAGCGGHNRTSLPPQNAVLPAPQLDGWSMPQLPATDAPQPSDPAAVRSRLAQYSLPLPATTREASGVIKHLPDDSLTVHNTYPNPGFYDFRVSTPFDAQTPSPLNITGSLTFSGPLTGRFVQVGLVNNATYNYAMDPDGDPNTNDANPSYLFNQNVVMVCALDTAGRPFAAPLDYNNSGGIGQGQAISGNLLTFNLKLQPSGSTGGTVALSVNNGAFGPAMVYGKNNWGWQPDESFAQARLVVQVYSYNPDPTPFTVSFKNVLADDPNYTPPVPTTDWVHTWGTSASESIRHIATDSTSYVTAVGYTYLANQGGRRRPLIEQYTPDGRLNWVRSWDPGADAAFQRVAVDSASNLVCVGFFGPAALIVKFDRSGNVLWSKVFGASGGALANDVVFDNAGNAFIPLYAFTDNESFATYRTVILKLSPQGALLDQTEFKTQDSGYIDSLALSNGQLFATGRRFAGLGQPQHTYLLTFDGALNVTDERQSNVDLDQLQVRPGTGSSLLIAGPYFGGELDGGPPDAYVVRYDYGLQATVWSKRISEQSGLLLKTLGRDASGNTFLCGQLHAGSNSRLFAAAIDQFGVLCSAQQIATRTAIAGLGTSADGSIFVGGAATNAAALDWNSTALGFSDWSIQFQPVAKAVRVANDGQLLNVTGVLTTPVGVQDTGGGDADALVTRHLLPNTPHSGGSNGPLQLDCTALPNARFTVWDPTGPTPYTGSLSTNSVFDASHTLYDGDKFYLSFDVDPALAPDDLAVYPPRPDGAAGGYVTVTPSGLALDPRLATWFTVPSGTNTLQLKTAAYSRVTNDLALGLPNALYTLRDTGTNATIGGPWETDQSSFQHVLLVNGLNFRPVFSARAYPLAGSSSAHGGAPETIYPNEWTLNWFNLTDGTLTEQGDNSSPSMRDYFTQSGLTNKLDKDAFVRIDCAASGVLHAPYDFELSPGFPGVTPFLSQLAQPQDVVTFARGQSLRCRDSNSSFSAPLLAVQANHKLNGSNSVTVTFNNGGGPLALTYLPTRVWDDPEASDPDANVAGSGPWTVGLGFAVQYGTGPWTVELDADYGSAWNDGTPGRVYTLSGSPFAVSGLQHVNQTIPGTQPRGTYKFALRVTDQQGRQYVYVWPNPVTLP